jgi:hypothetical protein
MKTRSATEGCVDIEALAQHSSSYIRGALASNPTTPPEVLRLLVNDPNDSVKLAAALNPECPLDVLRSLSEASDWNIRIGLANQLDICDDILSALLTHRNPYLAAQSRYALSAAAFERKVKELEIVCVPGTKYKLGELLIAAKQISPDHLASALTLGQTHHLRLGRVLLQTGMVKASVLIEALRLQSLLRKESIDLADATKLLTHARSHFYESKFLE